jgi:uncharacterized protein YkwD
MFIKATLLLTLFISYTFSEGPADFHVVPDELLRVEDNLTPVIDHITDYERSIIAEINLLRSNPRAYADKYLVPMLERSTTTYYVYPSGLRVSSNRSLENESIRTVIDEAIRALYRSNRLAPLSESIGMSRVSNWLVHNQRLSGEEGHTSSARERISMYGKPYGHTHEIIQYGLTDPTDIIIAFLLDDGVPNRGHRVSLLRSTIFKVGVATGDHPRHGHSCVVVFAQDFTENN